MKTLALCLALLAACGTPKDNDGACKSLCTTAMFTASRVDATAKEINCFCSGGTGTVASAACGSMCTGLGMKNSTVFKSTGMADDSCQCEP